MNCILNNTGMRTFPASRSPMALVRAGSVSSARFGGHDLPKPCLTYSTKSLKPISLSLPISVGSQKQAPCCASAKTRAGNDQTNHSTQKPLLIVVVSSSSYLERIKDALAVLEKIGIPFQIEDLSDFGCRAELDSSIPNAHIEGVRAILTCVEPKGPLNFSREVAAYASVPVIQIGHDPEELTPAPFEFEWPYPQTPIFVENGLMIFYKLVPTFAHKEFARVTDPLDAVIFTARVIAESEPYYRKRLIEVVGDKLLSVFLMWEGIGKKRINLFPYT